MSKRSVTAFLVLLSGIFASPLTSPQAGLDMRDTDDPLNAVPPVNQLDASPSADTLAKFKTAKIGDRFVEGDNTFIIQSLENADDKPDAKRQLQQCTTTTYKSVQVLSGQTGTLWGEWEPAAACYWAGSSSHADANCQEMGASVTTISTYSVGFDIDVVGDVLNKINGDGGLNFGYSWGQSQSTSTSQNCCPGADSVSQIWSQTLYGWSNSQVQTCEYNPCVFSTPQPSCGPWSAPQHANWPLPGSSKTVAYGCSTGPGNVNCSGAAS